MTLPALLLTLGIFISPSLFAAETTGHSDGTQNRSSSVASYQDIALQSIRLRYYLTTLTLRLGIPAYLNPPFEEDMAEYPQDSTLLLQNILAAYNQPAESAITVIRQGDALMIQVSPTLKTQSVDDETLLQTALTLIQQANDNRMPIINGRALKAALEQKNGIPVDVVKHNKETASASRH